MSKKNEEIEKKVLNQTINASISIGHQQFLPNKQLSLSTLRRWKIVEKQISDQLRWHSRRVRNGCMSTASSFQSWNRKVTVSAVRVHAVLRKGDCIEPCVREMQSSLEQTPMLQNEQLGQLSFTQLAGNSRDVQQTQLAFSQICQAYVNVDACLEQCEQSSESSATVRQTYAGIRFICVDHRKGRSKTFFKIHFGFEDEPEQLSITMRGVT
ncbi:hypothetical protein DICVIV_09698 [Dictyocaulus viviparus]|uniref:Uncharacterized protein n=1 Tax=Dictyocaulus viviparus TaxID=29172 RepID=A0A0D8XI01_DICVI|nr:hypothetical protein DICVIV_09698 [Dictyocaulus viviparus]